MQNQRRIGKGRENVRGQVYMHTVKHAEDDERSEREVGA